MQERLLYELGALALESKSRSEFRSAAFARISKVAGFDGACANSSPDGDEIHLDGWGIDATQLHRDQVEYMNEFSADEIRGITGPRVGVSDDFLTSRRQDSLRLFTEYLLPMNVYRYCMRLWVNRHGAFWYVFLREGRARWRARDLATLDAVMPLLSVSEAIRAASEGFSANRVEAQRELLREHRVARAERQVAELAERGLTNREIGALLSRSANTVRNQLSACCRKLRVSSRTELAYVLSNAEPVMLAQSPGARLGNFLKSVRTAPAPAAHRLGWADSRVT